MASPHSSSSSPSSFHLRPFAPPPHPSSSTPPSSTPNNCRPAAEAASEKEGGEEEARVGVRPESSVQKQQRGRPREGTEGGVGIETEEGGKDVEEEEEEEGGTVGQKVHRGDQPRGERKGAEKGGGGRRTEKDFGEAFIEEEDEEEEGQKDSGWIKNHGGGSGISDRGSPFRPLIPPRQQGKAARADTEEKLGGQEIMMGVRHHSLSFNTDIQCSIGWTTKMSTAKAASASGTNGGGNGGGNGINSCGSNSAAAAVKVVGGGNGKKALRLNYSHTHKHARPTSAAAAVKKGRRASAAAAATSAQNNSGGGGAMLNSHRGSICRLEVPKNNNIPGGQTQKINDETQNYHVLQRFLDKSFHVRYMRTQPNYCDTSIHT